MTPYIILVTYNVDGYVHVTHYHNEYSLAINELFTHSKHCSKQCIMMGTGEKGNENVSESR